jgi:hypothetical protein
LPFLAQEKQQREQVRRWLESNLQENAAREASQTRLQDLGTANAIKETLARSLSQYFETVPGGQFAMPGALKTTLPGFTSGIEELPNAPAELDAVTKNLVDIYNQFQTGEKISPEALRAVVGRVKGDIPLDVVKGSVTSGLERGRQALTERGYGLEERGLGVREKELGAKERELKGGGAKDAAAVMKEAQNDREASILKYGGVGQIFGLAPDAKRALKSSIKNANRRINAAAVSAGIESPIKAPQEMFKAGLAILSRYATKGELPSWYDLLFLGYDPDFVFGLQDVLERPDKKSKAPAEDSLKRAQALLQQILEDKVE